MFHSSTAIQVNRHLGLACLWRFQPLATVLFRLSKFPIQTNVRAAQVLTPQPHPAVLPHLRRFETPDMAQSGGCPQEEGSIHQLDRATQVTIFRLRTAHCQLLSHIHRLKISQPHPAILPHLRRFETPDMAQSGGCPQEALGTG